MYLCYKNKRSPVELIYYVFCFLQKPDKEKKKKETILDLSKYLEKPIRVKFSGGREGEH